MAVFHGRNRYGAINAQNAIFGFRLIGHNQPTKKASYPGLDSLSQGSYKRYFADIIGGFRHESNAEGNRLILNNLKMIISRVCDRNTGGAHRKTLDYNGPIFARN